MKLKQEIISLINNPASRGNICSRLEGCGDQALYKHLKANATNGRLTKMDVLKAISEETGVPVDQILEDVHESEAVPQR